MPPHTNKSDNAKSEEKKITISFEIELKRGVSKMID